MSHDIKLSGKFAVEFAPQIDRDYQIALTGGITSIAKTSNEDGTYSYTYNLKPVHGEIVNDKGETKKLSKKGSQAQRFRFMVEGMGREYEPTMSKLMDNIDQVLDLLDKL